MVIDDFYLLRAQCRPVKANAKLVVYTNAVLACAIATQGFKAIARRRSKVAQLMRGVQLLQFATGNLGDTTELA